MSPQRGPQSSPIDARDAIDAVLEAERKTMDAIAQCDRRARSLENVLLPQIQLEIRSIAEQLELIDQEDAIRVRVI